MMRIKGLTVLFILFVIGIVIVADLGIGSFLFALVNHIPGHDVTGHFVLIGTLAFLVNLSLSAARINVWGKPLLKGSVIVAGMVTVEEFSQIFVSSRGFSLIDLSADYLGIGLFGMFAAYLITHRARTA